MPERREKKKYTFQETFTVEGETEKWYLERLQELINSSGISESTVAIKVSVEQNPVKFIKNKNNLTTPSVVHFCDVESSEYEEEERFKRIINLLAEAKNQKRIDYQLGYSNFTFELWIALHKTDCFGPLTDRKQYLPVINKAFNENFQSLREFKEENNFKKCLDSLTLEDVKTAVKRSKTIMNNNRENKREILYKKYKYYKDNPSLTVWESVDRILTECGIQKKNKK